MASRLNKKNKFILSGIVLVVILIICIYIFNLLYYNRPVKFKENSNICIQVDSKYSIITQKEAEEIAVKESKKYDLNFSDYKYVEAMYMSDGNWHILWSDSPIDQSIGGGVVILVDEKQKHVIGLIPQQ